MNPKKLHEVCHIASLINDIATKTGCDVVVDVGSGLVSSGFLYFLYFFFFAIDVRPITTILRTRINIISLIYALAYKLWSFVAISFLIVITFWIYMIKK